MFGDRTRVAHREGFQIAAIDPADNIGAGIPDLEPAANAGTHQFHLVIEVQGSEDAVAGAGAGAQGQTVDVGVIIRRSRPGGQGRGWLEDGGSIVVR